jgi:hypothetical protein
MRLIIAGGRDFNDYDFLADETSRFIIENVGRQEEVIIISGLAKGADTLGCQLAQECGYPLEGFAAEWGRYGRSAGIKRNKLMAKSGTHLLAFWDGKSRGTMHMIDFAYEQGLVVKVIEYKGLI